MTTYNIVAATNEATVVAEYTAKPLRNVDYQSEAAMEKDFINRLRGQGYDYITITTEASLIANLRRQLELLYGESASLTIASNHETVCVRAVLPLMPKGTKP